MPQKYDVRPRQALPCRRNRPVARSIPATKAFCIGGQGNVDPICASKPSAASGVATTARAAAQASRILIRVPLPARSGATTT